MSSRKTRQLPWQRLPNTRESWWIFLTECCRYLLFWAFFLIMAFNIFFSFSCIKVNSRASDVDALLHNYVSYFHSSFFCYDQVLIKQEIQRKSGYAIQVDEEHLRVQLDTIQSELNAPTQFKVKISKLHQLWFLPLFPCWLRAIVSHHFKWGCNRHDMFYLIWENPVISLK